MMSIFFTNRPSLWTVGSYWLPVVVVLLCRLSVMMSTSGPTDSAISWASTCGVGRRRSLTVTSMIWRP